MFGVNSLLLVVPWCRPNNHVDQRPNDPLMEIQWPVQDPVPDWFLPPMPACQLAAAGDAGWCHWPNMIMTIFGQWSHPKYLLAYLLWASWDAFNLLVVLIPPPNESVLDAATARDLGRWTGKIWQFSSHIRPARVLIELLSTWTWSSSLTNCVLWGFDTSWMCNGTLPHTANRSTVHSANHTI